ncbi:PQQ-binding-like beta-propeller repeat protein [Streptomyces thermolineatus]|uniref:outer membrane protein assembly factor BamB family protein n=1 Tax=Streptomyces thermolineatus TaxID=44033 RepID=UPI0038500422
MGEDTVAGDGLPRRQAVAMLGKGLGLALLGAAAWGCGPEEQPASGPGREAGKGKGKDGDTFTTPPPGTAPEALWRTGTANDGLAGIWTLAVAGSTVLVSGDPLVGRDIATGEEVWSREGVAVPGAALLVGGGTLYLASAEYDGDVVGLDPATGRETWRSRLGKKYDQPRPIAADDGHVYVLAGILEEDFSTPNNVIAAIATGTGKVVWREQRDAGTDESGVTAAVADNRIVYTDFRENLTVRDTATGRQVWTKKIGRSNNRRLAVHDGLVILADGRRLRAFDLAGGGERWSLATDGFSVFSDPAVLDGVLYAADSGRSLWAVDPVTGKKIWRNEDLEDAAAPWQFAKVGDTLYGATEFDEDGGVHAFDADGGKLRWTYNDGTGDLQKWHLVASGKRLAALHGKRMTGLPAV